jgi:hypothetical protein
MQVVVLPVGLHCVAWHVLMGQSLTRLLRVSHAQLDAGVVHAAPPLETQSWFDDCYVPYYGTL